MIAQLPTPLPAAPHFMLPPNTDVDPTAYANGDAGNGPRIAGLCGHAFRNSAEIRSSTSGRACAEWSTGANG